MVHLLIGSVVVFQITILITIIYAAKKSRILLTFTTIAWSLFTLIGSIFTAGLMLLQLFTIFIAYKIGSYEASKNLRIDNGNGQTHVNGSKESNWSVYAIGMALVAIYTYNKTFNFHSTAPLESSPAKLARQEIQVTPKPLHPLKPKSSSVLKQKIYSKSKVNTEYSKCFSLKTYAEILQCLN